MQAKNNEVATVSNNLVVTLNDIMWPHVLLMRKVGLSMETCLHMIRSMEFDTETILHEEECIYDHDVEVLNEMSKLSLKNDTK